MGLMKDAPSRAETYIAIIVIGIIIATVVSVISMYMMLESMLGSRFDRFDALLNRLETSEISHTQTNHQQIHLAADSEEEILRDILKNRGSLPNE